MMNGGYLMVSKTDTNLYEKLNKALTSGKPVLWYDENTCYYIDTITKSGTDIILTKGGRIITIESDGDITEVGNINNNIYSHNITIRAINSGDVIEINFMILNNNANVINTISKINNFLLNYNFNDSDNKMLMCTGQYGSKYVNGIYVDTETEISLACENDTSESFDDTASDFTIEDTIIQLI